MDNNNNNRPLTDKADLFAVLIICTVIGAVGLGAIWLVAELWIYLLNFHT